MDMKNYSKDTSKMNTFQKPGGFVLPKKHNNNAQRKHELDGKKAKHLNIMDMKKYSKDTSKMNTSQKPGGFGLPKKHNKKAQRKH